MKIATILLVCQVGVTGAETQCSDSLGNCAKPRASLMQLKTLKQKQQLKTTFGAQLASFQKFTDEMVAKYGASDDNFTDPMIQTAVSTVLDFIHEMHASLLGYHDQDVTAAGSCGVSSISETCKNTYLTTAIIQDIEDFNQTANDHHGKFLDCMTTRATECNNENLLCERYDTYRTQDGEITGGLVLGDGKTEYNQFRQYLPPCVSNGDFGEAFIRADHETEAAKLKKMEECLVDTEKWLNGEFPPPGYISASNKNGNRYDGLWPHYDQCKREHDDCKDHESLCKNNQTKFEESYCTYEMWWDSKCGAWETCATAAQNACKGTEASTGTCDQIQQNVLGRKADNETGMRLECLLQVLFGKYDPEGADGEKFSARLPGDKRMEALDNCTKQTYDTSFWDVPCEVGGDITPPAICSRTCPHEPPTDTFKTLYYYNEGLERADADLLASDPAKHGKEKRIFPSSDACNLLEGHESYECHLGA